MLPAEQTPAVQMAVLSPRSWLRWAPGVATAFVVAAVLSALATGDVGATIAIDMEATAGGRVELFVNDLTRPPFTERLDSRGRHRYVFTGVTEDITMLRLDPTDDPSASVRIYGIEVSAGGRQIAHFGPEDLKQWTAIGFAPAVEDGALSFAAASSDPILTTTQAVRLPPIPIWDWLARTALVERPGVLPCVALPMLALLAAARRFRTSMLVAAALVSVPLAFKLVAHVSFSPPPVTVAVSRAAFLGLSAGPARAVMVIGLLACGVLAVALAVGAVRPRVAAETIPASWSWPSVLAGAAVLAAIALLVAPDLPHLLASFPTTTYYPHWDSDNINYWAYQASLGQLPFRDYWYTYGGQYLFDLTWPAGPLVRWIFDASVYGLALAALWMIAPRRRVAAALAIGFLLMAERLGLAPVASRYLIGVDVVLVYLALASAERVRVWHVILTLATFSMATTIELVHVIYTAPAIALAVLVDGLCLRPKSAEEWRRLLMPSLVLAGSATLAFLVQIAVLAFNGQLPGAIEFYRSLGELVQYGTFPTAFDGLGWQVFDLRLAILWWPILALSLGLYERLTAATANERTRGLALLAIGGLSLVVLQKHIVRPMDEQLLVFPFAALIVYSLLLPWPLSTAKRVLVGACAGILLAVVPARGQLPAIADLVSTARARAMGSVRVLADPARTALANGERFAPNRFAGHVPEQELVAELERRIGHVPTLFSMTDSPVLYILTGQPTVWASNMYNASPVREQARIVRWLEESGPEFVVFRRDRLEWDTFSLLLRIPNVVQAVLALYAPDSHVGVYEVLRRRRPGEPLDLATWHEWFGGNLALGHLPALIDISGRAPCTAGGACDRYVVMEVTPTRAAPELATLSFELEGQAFRLQLILVPGQSRYVVPMERLWFAEAFRSVQTPLTPGIISPTPEAPPTLTVVSLAHDSARLY